MRAKVRSETLLYGGPTPRTENCIVCLQKARNWTCHVLKGKVMVTAGWCNTHKNHSDVLKMTAPACFGEWKPEYGIIEDKN